MTNTTGKTSRLTSLYGMVCSLILVLTCTCITNLSFAQNHIVNTGSFVQTGGQVVLKDAVFNNKGSFLHQGIFKMAGDDAIVIISVTKLNLDTLEIAINTGDTVYLHRSAMINDVIMSRGMLEIDSANMTINPGGQITGAISNRAILTVGDGKVWQTVGNSPVTFPIQAGTFLPLTMTNDGTSDVYGVRVLPELLENGDMGIAFTEECVPATWDVMENMPGGSDLTMEFQWDAAAELANFDRTDMAAIWHTGMDWDTLSTGSAVGSDPYSFTTSGIDVIGTFGLYDGALPDVDGDGFSIDVDCDDGDPNINPGVAEVCNDGIDNNCNGFTDSDEPFELSCNDVTVTLDKDGQAVIDPMDLYVGPGDECGLDTLIAEPDVVNCDDLGGSIVRLIGIGFNGYRDTCESNLTVLNTPPVFGIDSGALDVTIYVEPGVTNSTYLEFNGCSISTGIVDSTYSLIRSGFNLVGSPIYPDPDYYLIWPFDTFQLTDGGMLMDTAYMTQIETFNCSFNQSCEVVHQHGFTVADICGSRSEEYLITMTFIDRLPPVAQCQDITVTLDNTGNASIDSLATDDGSYSNCNTITNHLLYPNTFTCQDTGSLIATLVVTDDNGNSDTCTSTIVVTGIDMDGDGYFEACGDCNDMDPNINPGAPEICNDGIDNNCDMIVDDANEYGYCCASATNPNYFIEFVRLAYPVGNTLLLNNSGPDPFGYGYYANPHVNVPAAYVPTIYFSVKPGLRRTTYFRIWVDWDQDNEFDDFEIVGQRITNNTWNGQFSVPADLRSIPGQYFMRIIGTGRGYADDPCAEIPRGEVEDYIICIADGCGGQGPPIQVQIPDTDILHPDLVKPDLQSDFALDLYPNPFNDQLTLKINLDEPQNLKISILNQQGGLLQTRSEQVGSGTHSTTMDMSELVPGLYYVQIQAGDQLIVRKVVKM